MMRDKELDNLVKIGQLKKEPFSQSGFDIYIRSGKERLQDTLASGISLSGKFLLGYRAAYSFSLAALRRHGYRPANRTKTELRLIAALASIGRSGSTPAFTSSSQLPTNGGSRGGIVTGQHDDMDTGCL